MRVLVVLASLLWTGTALAEAPEEVIYRRHTVVVFGDDTIDGNLDHADLGYIQSRKDGRHEMLIRVRDSFRTEILSSVRRF